jgi:hypothetical protein
MLFKSSRTHAEELVVLLRKLADLIDTDPSRVNWRETQKIARFFWQGTLIGRYLKYRESKNK